VIAKSIKPKRQFVKLFEQNNFVTLLHVFFGKIKNVLHLLWMGTKNFTPITIYMGFEHKTCKKIETCLTI